ncbi:MAG: NADH-quinone oxidoreductase subunit M [Planctomycetota bacterium]
MILPESYTIPFQLILPALFALGLLLPIKSLSTRRGAWLYSATTSTISFLFTLYVASVFDWSNSGELQFVGQIPWVPGFGLGFDYGMDGMSLWLVLLTTFLMPIVVLGSLVEVKGDMRTFHFWLHILEAALIGTFIARDIIFFYVCFEFTLIPLFFLIGIFGHGEKLKAAKVFFFYTFTASLLTMAGALYVAWFNTTLDPASAAVAEVYRSINFDAPKGTADATAWALSEYAGQWTFNIKALWAAGRMMPIEAQIMVMLAFLAGFGVKTPLFPFHTWLPLAHTEAPTAGSVDLAGLVLKLGPYGLLRLAIPMLPMAAVTLAPWLGGLAVIGVIYAALVCWVQKDAKKLIAYSSVSHMGFCILGLFAFDPGSIGATGAFIYMLSHGLATGGMFLCIGMLYDRFKTREIARMSGLAKIMPAWAFFFCLFTFASVGLPGLNGFVGEFLTMLGTFNSAVVGDRPLLGPIFAIPAALGVILAAIYLLYLLGKIVFGPLELPHWEDTGETGIGGGESHDLSYREAMTLAPLAAACLLIGLYPYPILRSLEPAIQNHTQYVEAYIEEINTVGEAVAEAGDDVEVGERVDLNAKAPSRQDAKEINNEALFPGLHSELDTASDEARSSDLGCKGTDGWIIVGGSGLNRGSTVFYTGDSPETATLPDSFRHFLADPSTTVVFPEGSK